MTAVKLGTWTPEDPEWHEVRRPRVGGSEIGTIMGWNPFQTADELADRKRGEKPPRPDTPATIRGRYLEPAVLKWLCDTENLEIDHYPCGTWADGICLYTPDAVTADGRLVEIKTAGVKDPEKGWGRAGTDQIPLAYQAQCLWGMGILGFTECLVGVCFGQPFEFRRYRVKFDARVFDILRSRAERFITDLGVTE